MLKTLYLKDLKLLIRDPKRLIVYFIMPMALTTILSFALKGSFDVSQTDQVRAGVVIEYNESEDLKAIQRLKDRYEIEETIDMNHIIFDDFFDNEVVSSVMSYKIMDKTQAEQALSNDTIDAIIVFPEHFIYDLYVNLTMPNRNKIVIPLTISAENSYDGRMVEAIFETFTDTLNRQIIKKSVFLEIGVTSMDLQTLYENIEAIYEYNSEPIDFDVQTVQDTKPISSFTYYAIGMMAMFILYAADYSGRELLKEKQAHTLDRNGRAGIRYSKMLSSKYLLTLTLVIVQMLVLLIFSKLILKVDWVLSLPLFLGVLMSAFAVSGMGVFLGAITLIYDSYKIANIYQTVIIHIFSLVGGSYGLVSQFAPIFQYLKYFAINGTVIDLFIKIYQERPVGEMVFYHMILFLMGFVFTFVGYVLIKKKEVEVYVGAVES